MTNTQDPNTDEIEVTPKSSCRHCFGTGFIGRNVITGHRVVCSCVRKQLEKIHAQGKKKLVIKKDPS